MICHRKIILIALTLIIIPSYLLAVMPPPERILLKTGEVYTGEIILQNENIILIRTVSGERFQFPASQVKSITKISDTNEEVNAQEVNTEETLPELSTHNFCGVVEFSGGTVSGKNSFKSSPFAELTLSFGTRSIAGKSLFLGAGAGFSGISIASDSETQLYTPVFVRLQSNNLSHLRTSPYISLDAGYAIALKSTLSGGAFAKLSAGIIHRISYKTSVNFGVFARVQQFNGPLTEKVQGNSYSYAGNSGMTAFGALAGFQF